MPATDQNTPGGALGLDVLEREQVVVDHGWNVIVWNDPVNLMDYVTNTFRRILRIDREEAEQLMITIHTHGKGAVFNGTQAEAETKVAAFNAAMITAQMERA